MARIGGRLARGRPDIQARLDQLKLYMHYVHLRWSFEHEKDAARKKEVARALLTYIYRLRKTYLIFSRGFLYYWTPNVAKEFQEPQWRFALPGGSGPYVDRPFTRAEPDDFDRAGSRHSRWRRACGRSGPFGRPDPGLARHLVHGSGPGTYSGTHCGALRAARSRLQACRLRCFTPGDLYLGDPNYPPSRI